MEKIDITGRKFGRLEAMYESTKDITGLWKWMCKCDCGNIIEVRKQYLLIGIKKSCGCLSTGSHRKDITNQKFGSLIAKYPLEKVDKSGSMMWHFECDCGNTTDKSYRSIKNSKIPSCGCKPRGSKGDYFEKRRTLLEQLVGDSYQDVLKNKELQEKICDLLTKRWNRFGSSKNMTRNLEIFRKRYFSSIPITLEEIGKEYGISREAVRVIESKLVNRIKKILTSPQKIGKLEVI